MNTRKTSDGRDLAPELQEILRKAEMRGERTVNHFRAVFYSLSMLMLGASLHLNTPAANFGFVVQVAVMVSYTALVYLWFAKKSDHYAPWLKYVSITVDLAALHASALIMGHNHAGVLEYFQGFVPLVLVLWNIFSAFRFRERAALYSGSLSLVLSFLVLAWAATAGGLALSDVSVYGQQAINLGDEAVRAVFIALPAFFGAFIARNIRGLVLRAEQESLHRADLERQKDHLSKYLSREIVDAVLANPALLRLGGTRREASVLFCDIRNFTPLAERSPPEQVVQLLNEHFTNMVEIVFKYGGTLDKFLGDGLMAVFGAPTAVGQHELRSVLVAIEMVSTVAAFNARHKETGDQPLEVGVGIASGSVVAGNIGSPERMDYTAIGDTVNFAARLEGLNRQFETRIIMSETTALAVSTYLPVTALPPTEVKGKSGRPPLFAIDVHAVSSSTLDEVRALVLNGTPPSFAAPSLV